MIYLDKGTQILEYEDGKSKTISARAGEVQWDPKGGMHTSMIPAGPPFRIVEVELKKSGGEVTWPQADPLNVAPSNYTVELENAQVRVLRVKVGPHQKIVEHQHAVPRVIVPLTEVNIAVTGADGTKGAIKAKPGEVLFGQPARHREENTLDTPVELILIEMKG
jgi:hypothetical protein